MKYLAAVTLIALCGVSAACSDDSPTSPSDGNRIVFTSQLRASNEVPPVANAEANASGTATITLNVTRSGSTITAGTVDFQFSLTGFPAGSSAIAAHIHPGAAGTTGGVLINTGLSAGTAISMPAGTGSFSVTGMTATATDLQAIIDNPAAFYFNVHTTLNPGGAVRGQLVRQ
jgi:hypothetical protein